MANVLSSKSDVYKREEDVEIDFAGLRLCELVLHLQGCPLMLQASKQALYDSARHLNKCRWQSLDMFVNVEETQPAWRWFRRSESEVRKATNEESGGFEIADAKENLLLPFPCSYGSCPQFHENPHGFCPRHRFKRFQKKAMQSLQMAWCCFELLLLFSVQAAVELRSRALLALILLSLLPVTYVFLEASTGLYTTFIFISLLVIVLLSFFFTALRFDQMQQRLLKLTLATEAGYSEVLRGTATQEGLTHVSRFAQGFHVTCEIVEACFPLLLFERRSIISSCYWGQAHEN